VQDEIENTYDQCFSEACTYKPLVADAGACRSEASKE